MSTKLILAAVIAMPIFFSSCSKEDVSPEPILIDTNSGSPGVYRPPTLPEEQPPVKGEGAYEIIAEPQGVTEDLIKSNISIIAPVAELSLSPCGYGFYANITSNGAPVTGQYQYKITLKGTNTVVDSGIISHGGNTSWNLNSCTEYDIEFWGNTVISTSTSTQTVSTDGCNGVFNC